MLVMNSRHGTTMLTIIENCYFKIKLLLLEAKTRGSWVWGQLQLHRDFQVSMGYTARPYLKKKTFLPKSQGFVLRYWNINCQLHILNDDTWIFIVVPSTITPKVDHTLRSISIGTNKQDMLYPDNRVLLNRTKEATTDSWMNISFTMSRERSHTGRGNVIYMKL